MADDPIDAAQRLDSRYRDAVADAHKAARVVLEATGMDVTGVVVLAELDRQGVTIAADERTDVKSLSLILAEASWRAAGARPA